MISNPEAEALIQEWLEIMRMADELNALLCQLKWSVRTTAGWSFDECMIDILTHA